MLIAQLIIWWYWRSGIKYFHMWPGGRAQAQAQVLAYPAQLPLISEGYSQIQTMIAELEGSTPGATIQPSGLQNLCSFWVDTEPCDYSLF